MAETTTFAAPTGRLIEWPRGSGRRARYSTPEQRVMRDLVAEAERVPHRKGCPGVPRDVAACERCRRLNELEVIHEAKVVFGIDLVADAWPVSEGGDAA